MPAYAKIWSVFCRYSKMPAGGSCRRKESGRIGSGQGMAAWQLDIK